MNVPLSIKVHYLAKPSRSTKLFARYHYVTIKRLWMFASKNKMKVRAAGQFPLTQTYMNNAKRLTQDFSSHVHAYKL